MKRLNVSEKIRWPFIFFALLSLSLIFTHASAQLSYKETRRENRDRLYRNIIKNTINGNLSRPLNDSTEEYWQDAFWAMIVTRYKSPWVTNKIHVAFANLKNRSNEFQRSLLELGCALYPDVFNEEVKYYLGNDPDSTLFALAETYLLLSPATSKNYLEGLLKKKISDNPGSVILERFKKEAFSAPRFITVNEWKQLFEKNFLPGKPVLFSIQRHNRDYPGIMIFRDSNGNFLKDSLGSLIYYPQLARSLTNLPWYFRNGNTPQGIYRMAGFDVSGSVFIGPTPNLQMRMPYEIGPNVFLDSGPEDSVWTIDRYAFILPGQLKNRSQLYESYYAGMLGRTEIIAHGTTVDPELYNSLPCYPLTPTQGCLTSKEIWDDRTGILKDSDQRRMVDALLKAGGSGGYVVVLELDDKNEPVTAEELMPMLKP